MIRVSITLKAGYTWHESHKKEFLLALDWPNRTSSTNNEFRRLLTSWELDFSGNGSHKVLNLKVVCDNHSI